MSEQPGNALRATPATYARLFEGTPDGQLVLQDLCKRFHVNPYVKGGEDAQRETMARLHRREVIDFMLNQIGRTPEEDDAEG